MGIAGLSDLAGRSLARRLQVVLRGRDDLLGDSGGPLSAASAGTIVHWAPLLGIKLMARSASAVMVRLGFTPKFEGTIEPSMMYSPG